MVKQYNAADAEQVEAKKDRSRRDKVTERLITSTLMSTVDGRRYVWLKLEDGKVFSSTICFGEDGFAKTAFLEGKRSVALALLSDCMAITPESFILMLKENSKNKEIQDAGRTNSSSADPGSSSDDPLDAD